MPNKFSTVALVIAMVCTLGPTSAFANAPSDPEVNLRRNPLASGTASKKEAQPNEKLRADMVKLITDAKAGKVVPTDRPQIQSAKSNNLSKGKKIAIGVAIAVAVVAVIVVVAAKNTPGRVL